jgi:serine/threonine protein kinase
VEILKRLNHPNIVQIVEYFHQHTFLYILQEHIPGKTLCSLLCEDYFKDLTLVINIVRQILIALSFCHQKGYAHKAINPEHVMLVKLGQGILIKLVGFGHAHKIGAPIITSAITSSSIFNAPEAYNEQAADKQDIWGTGVILLELLSGQRNFPDFVEKKDQIVREVVERQQLDEEHRSIMLDFISRMLETSPLSRFSAE